MFDGKPKDETLLMMENYIIFGAPVKNAGCRVKRRDGKRTENQKNIQNSFSVIQAYGAEISDTEKSSDFTAVLLAFALLYLCLYKR